MLLARKAAKHGLSTPCPTARRGIHRERLETVRLYRLGDEELHPFSERCGGALRRKRRRWDILSYAKCARGDYRRSELKRFHDDVRACVKARSHDQAARISKQTGNFCLRLPAWNQFYTRHRRYLQSRRIACNDRLHLGMALMRQSPRLRHNVHALAMPLVANTYKVRRGGGLQVRPICLEHRSPPNADHLRRINSMECKQSGTRPI